jgi:cyclophilin family peptidyl-prolyl cis-trans isomerase
LSPSFFATCCGSISIRGILYNELTPPARDAPRQVLAEPRENRITASFRVTFPCSARKLDAVKRSTFLHVVFLSVLACFFTGAAQAAEPVVVIKTSLGSITVQLDPAHAPKTVANFLSYVDKKAYDGTIFHRVIPDFMIQGGGFKPDMTEISYDPPVVNEAATSGLQNMRGTIAMARTSEPNSATAQFFINLVDNTSTGKKSDGSPATDLGVGGVSPDGYAVFGKVISGLDVVDKIAKVQTGSVNGMDDVPTQTVTIISVRRK